MHSLHMFFTKALYIFSETCFFEHNMLLRTSSNTLISLLAIAIRDYFKNISESSRLCGFWKLRTFPEKKGFLGKLFQPLVLNTYIYNINNIKMCFKVSGPTSLLNEF